MLDLAGLHVLYHSIIQYRPSSTADSIAIVETESVPSTIPVTEQIKSQPKPTSEPVSILPVPLAVVTTGLMVITNPSFPTLIFEPASSAMVTDPVSSVASMLIYVETPSRLTASSAPLMTAPMTPSTVITTKPMNTSPSRIIQSPGVIEVEKEFVAELVDSFFKSLSRCLLLVLKG